MWLCWVLLAGECLLAGIDFLCYEDLRWMLPLQLLLVPYVKAMYRMEKRRIYRQFQREFRELLQSMMTALQAGYSLENACRAAVVERRSALRRGGRIDRLLWRLEQGLDLHIPVDRLFDRLAEDTGSEDCHQFSVILEIIRGSGGNTVEILRNSIDHLERKLAAEEEIKVLLSGRIFEKNIMLLMPFIILFYLRLTNPAYLDWYYRSFSGHVVMTVMIAGCLVCYRWAERIMDIEM